LGGPDFADALNTIQQRHIQIYENQVGRICFQERKKFRTIFRKGKFHRTGDLAHNLQEQPTIIFVVISKYNMFDIGLLAMHNLEQRIKFSKTDPAQHLDVMTGLFHP
jgi:hypothetical protein